MTKFGRRWSDDVDLNFPVPSHKPTKKGEKDSFEFVDEKGASRTIFYRNGRWAGGFEWEPLEKEVVSSKRGE